MKRYVPLAILLVFMVGAYWLEIHHYFSFDTIKDRRQELLHFVQSYPLLAPIIFMSVYALATALSIPGGLFLSILGGFLFPQPFATIYIVFGATFGATLLFLCAKTALGDLLRKKAGKTMNKMRDGFQEDAAHYLLFLRLVPLFPFWLVNLAPAFFGVPLKTYVWTTFIGIIPGAFVFAQAGVGLGSVFENGEKFSLTQFFNNDVKIALVALALFALIPIVIKRVRRYP